MNCIICGSPYPYTTDGRCKNCIGKVQTFYFKSYGAGNIKRTNTEDGLTKEEEQKFYKHVLSTKLTNL